MKAVICVPTVTRPYASFLAALEASVPALDAAGIEHATVYEVGSPYISGARSWMTRKALNAGADVVVYLDHDVSWRPQDLVRLIVTPGHVVAGTYRFKSDTVEYMGQPSVRPDGTPLVREDGCIKMDRIPAGFMKISREGIDLFMASYPDLVYGPYSCPSVDLFNHGAVLGDRQYYGEDYAFSHRWNDKCGPIWLIPDLRINHHGSDGTEYHGNYHEYLLGCPGGSNSESPNQDFDHKRLLVP